MSHIKDEWKRLLDCGGVPPPPGTTQTDLDTLEIAYLTGVLVGLRLHRASGEVWEDEARKLIEEATTRIRKTPRPQ
jgi:hypothetical protein